MTDIRRNNFPIVEVVYVTDVENDGIMVQRADGSLHCITYAVSDVVAGGCLSMLHRGTKLHLIDPIEECNTLTAQFIVVAPDYLVDVSALSECCKPIGNLWQYYFYERMRQRETTKHIMLGNAANMMLDELVNTEESAAVDNKMIAQKLFRSAPLELTVCDNIDASFFSDMELHQRNLSNAIDDFFSYSQLQRCNGIIEPSFISPILGLRGRLDYLQITDKQAVGIELKSGKNDNGYIAQSHRVQLSLYQLMLSFALHISTPDFYALYSRYATGNFIKSKLSKSLMQQVLGVRNRIVVEEQALAQGNQAAFMRLLQAWQQPSLEQPQHPLARYIVAPMQQMASRLMDSDIAVVYFTRFYKFISQELYLSKMSRAASEREGITTLWQCSVEEKRAMGCIIAPLVLEINNITDTITQLQFGYNIDRLSVAPNFREGDMILLYAYDDENSNVTNKPLFRANLVSITSQQVILQLRDRQQGKTTFECGRAYAIEPDYADSAYVQQFRGLNAFVSAPRERQQLLLGYDNYLPYMGTPASLNYNYPSPEIEKIISHAVGGSEIYLLLGPPGTGKTSVALLGMVKELMARPGIDLLLIAYTNRAVDEICENLESCPQFDYIRIGQELSCHEAYRHRLLQNRTAGCSKRSEVAHILSSCHLYVASLVSLMARPDIFKIKHFDTAIIDEAAQLLEPQLLGLFSATDAMGNMAIDHFILIGDYLQLPAIVQQSVEESKVEEPILHKCGLTDCRISLFERLYRRYEAFPQLTGMLSCQWRMHPDIANFASVAFYKNKLQHGCSPHQCSALPFAIYDETSCEERILATRRLAFIDVLPSEKDRPKSSIAEARYVANLVEAYCHLCECNNIEIDLGKAIGVITPYRNQIAAIRQEIARKSISGSEEIRVDTVERFQGSQNDFIIFSCAVATKSQLDFLSTYTMEDDHLIDRKLNVAMTRARNQMVVLGYRQLLETNPIYKSLIYYIEHGKIEK